MNNIAVIGAGDCDKAACDLAHEVGREIAKAGAVLVCGGLGGIMEAACRGAFDEKGLTIGILPQADKSSANDYLSAALPTGLGLARNILVVSCADVLIAIGGRFGTLSEIAFALNTTKPVVGLNTWELVSPDGATAPIIKADSPDDAVRKALAAIGPAR